MLGSIWTSFYHDSEDSGWNVGKVSSPFLAGIEETFAIQQN